MKHIQEFYIYLRSQQTARDYLYKCYQKIDLTDPEMKSYDNAQKFMYYLDHGIRFYENGRKLETFARPILYFYGMVHLLKACLLTKRPDYPESTALLAHGVTARKKKKKNYTFMEDEVKIQVDGLFPYFSEHLFSKKLLRFDKVKMEHLLALIPEINILFQLDGREKLLVVGSRSSTVLQFPTWLLDYYHLTEKSFLSRLKEFLPEIVDVTSNDSLIQIRLANLMDTRLGPFFVHSNGEIYFPMYREHFLPISEVMVHYLLLYNLSMLCRYETQWWGDLFASKPDRDYPFITHFLQVTAEKIPVLLADLLEKR